jgi:hypothetical protein
MRRKAQCGCGSVTVVTSADPKFSFACPCDSCQRSSGSIAVFGAAFREEDMSSIDGETREICHAKRWAELLNYRASLLAGEDLQVSGFGEDVPNVNIRCPDGEVIAGRDPGVEKFLSARLGKPVGLAPLAHPGDIDHYRLAKARTSESTATEMQLLDAEAFPDLSSMPQALMIALADSVTPPGCQCDG